MMSDICKVSDGTILVGKYLMNFLIQVVYGNGEIYPRCSRFSVILKFVRQFKFAKCQKIKCQETSKSIRFCVACFPKKRIIDDFSKRQIDFSIL
jgi:hypothetical protein